MTQANIRVSERNIFESKSDKKTKHFQALKVVYIEQQRMKKKKQDLTWSEFHKNILSLLFRNEIGEKYMFFFLYFYMYKNFSRKTDIHDFSWRDEIRGLKSTQTGGISSTFVWSLICSLVIHLRFKNKYRFNSLFLNCHCKSQILSQISFHKN